MSARFNLGPRRGPRDCDPSSAGLGDVQPDALSVALDGLCDCDDVDPSRESDELSGATTSVSWEEAFEALQDNERKWREQPGDEDCQEDDEDELGDEGDDFEIAWPCIDDDVETVPLCLPRDGLARRAQQLTLALNEVWREREFEPFPTEIVARFARSAGLKIRAATWQLDCEDRSPLALAHLRFPLIEIVNDSGETVAILREDVDGGYSLFGLLEGAAL
jgi:hypothetical protein